MTFTGSTLPLALLCKRKTSFLLLGLRFFKEMASGTQNTNSGQLFIYRLAKREHDIRCMTFSSGTDDDKQLCDSVCQHSGETQTLRYSRLKTL